MQLDPSIVPVVVRLRRDAAAAWRQAAPADGRSAGEDVRAVLAGFGARLEPLHPNVSDPELGSYFTSSGLPPAQAEQLAARLRQLGSVEAAYVQPTPSPA
jgi:hypothetical protein